MDPGGESSEGGYLRLPERREEPMWTTTHPPTPTHPPPPPPPYIRESLAKFGMFPSSPYQIGVGWNYFYLPLLYTVSFTNGTIGGKGGYFGAAKRGIMENAMIY